MEVKLDAGAQFSKGGKYAKFGGQIQRIQVGGVPADKGLFMRPPGRGSVIVTYRLNRQYHWFKADVGLTDGSTDFENLIFKVICDRNVRRELKLSAANGNKEERHIDIDIHDVDTLELSVSVKILDHHAYPVWVDPQVGR
jgi:hypothetical protein